MQEKEQVLSELRSSLSKANNEVEKFKVAMEELRKASVNEQEELDKLSKNAVSRARELRIKLNDTEKLLDTMKDQNRALKRERDTMRADCEQMLNVMNKMEKDLEAFESREEETMVSILYFPC